MNLVIFKWRIQAIAIWIYHSHVKGLAHVASPQQGKSKERLILRMLNVLHAGEITSLVNRLKWFCIGLQTLQD